jgi:hypothetical protein
MFTRNSIFSYVELGTAKRPFLSARKWMNVVQRDNQVGWTTVKEGEGYARTAAIAKRRPIGEAST